MNDKSLTTYVFALVICASVIAVKSDCITDQLYTIHNVVNDWTLDVSNPDQAQIQHYNGSTGQQFRLEIGNRPGLFYFVHNASGYVLDLVRSGEPYTVLLAPKDGSLWQQWALNENSYIINAGLRYVLDIDKSNFEGGTPVILWASTGNYNQIWIVEKEA